MNFIYQFLICLGAIVVYVLVVCLLSYFIPWVSSKGEPLDDNEEYLLTVIVIQAFIAMFFIGYIITHI